MDSSCSPTTINNRTRLPVLWENGKAQALPTVGRDPDGVAYWINDRGQAVGDTGNCSAAMHAVSWENRTATPLPDKTEVALPLSALTTRAKLLGSSAVPMAQRSMAHFGKTAYSQTLNPQSLGDFGGIASGINNKGQVVGSNFDSNFNWSDGFIYENGVMTNLNTLIPASTNLYVTMANKINERGQISGMAKVARGPDANIHAVLLTPVNESIGRSMADVAPTHPKSNLPANVNQEHSPRFMLGQFGR